MKGVTSIKKQIIPRKTDFLSFKLNPREATKLVYSLSPLLQRKKNSPQRKKGVKRGFRFFFVYFNFQLNLPI